MRFGEALAHARKGKKIARRGWNGRGMYVYVKPGRIIPLEFWEATMPSEEPTEDEKKKGYVVILPHLDMVNAQGERIIGWLASQIDMLIDDWYVVDEEVRKNSVDLAKEKVKTEGMRSLKDRIELEGADMNSAYPKVVN